jgi:hypothetical protein
LFNMRILKIFIATYLWLKSIDINDMIESSPRLALNH